MKKKNYEIFKLYVIPFIYGFVLAYILTRGFNLTGGTFLIAFFPVLVLSTIIYVLILDKIEHDKERFDNG